MSAPFSPLELHLFNEGRYFHAYERFGGRIGEENGKKGAWFSVWAPAAERVSVVGDFNSWSAERNPLSSLQSTGIWAGFVPDARIGQTYKFRIIGRDGAVHLKADPFARRAEIPPKTASVLWESRYRWKDSKWMRARAGRADGPISIYEVHLGSWRRGPDHPDVPLGYAQLAEELPRYVKEMGFTHAELLPIAEHPFYGSWGYQATGYFAPTSRYGTPDEFRVLIDRFHQMGIGVILDWVPSHFPDDPHGLGRFDGSALYEHADPRRGYHPDWKSLIFNYGRNEVRSFLVSDAFYWLEEFHIDALRVDAVASMLHLDYSRKAGEWIPNRHGGNEDLEAVAFLRELNDAVHEQHPDVLMIAEESSAWPGVTRPTKLGGLGFDLKWDMGWMHDSLEYFRRDPVYRKYEQEKLTFRPLYAFSEDFALTLSHDEVVYGKGSLLGKMPGDDWQRFANLRAFYAYQFAVPGRKLLFMGSEFAQRREWNHDSSLDWHLLESPMHRGISTLIRGLNHLYRTEPALSAGDHDPAGFEWLDFHDRENSVISFFRKVPGEGAEVIAVFNFTPVPRDQYRLGVPAPGKWSVILDTDSPEYGGIGYSKTRTYETEAFEAHGRPFSITVALPPLSGLYLKRSPA